MKIVLWIFAVILGLPLLMIGGFFVYQSYNVYTHAFRLTGEIETPAGLKTGSSVISVTCQGVLDWPKGMRQYSGGCAVKGEAPFIDLGDGRHVIMLLALGPRAQDVDIYNLAAKALDRYVARFFVSAPNWTGSAELRPDLIPTLISFTDIADPASAKVVFAGGLRQLERFPGTEKYRTEPAVLIDEIAATFGPGFAFRRATIEMVPNGTPVTRGIEKKLPWWNGPNRPAAKALRSASLTTGSSIEAEFAFVRK